MKKNAILLSILIALFFTSCGGEEKSESSITDESTELKDTVAVAQAPEEDVVAIALWETTLREEPVSNNVKWVSGGTVAYGNKLLLTGDTASEGKTMYSKVKLASGHEGWIKDYLIAKDAKVAVVVEPTSIYKNPDIMSLDRETKLETGKIIAVINPTEDIGFVQFYGKEKNVRGWIKEGSGISSEDVDIEVALLRKAALQEKDSALKIMKIQEILDNPAYMSSKLYANLSAKVQGNQEEAMEEQDYDMETGEFYEEEGL